MDDDEPYRACLDTSSYGTGGQIAAIGGPIAFTLIAVGAFLRWQIMAESSLPVARLVPDLEGSLESLSKVKCLVFNWIPAGMKLPCWSLPLWPKPLEYVGTGVWSGFIFSWPYNVRCVELTHLPPLTQPFFLTKWQRF